MVINPPLKIVHKLHYFPLFEYLQLATVAKACQWPVFWTTRYLWLIPLYVCMPPELQEYSFELAVHQSHSCWLMPWQNFYYDIRTNWLYFGRRWFSTEKWIGHLIKYENRKKNPFIKHSFFLLVWIRDGNSSVSPFLWGFCIIKMKYVHIKDEKDKAAKCILITAHWLCHSALQLHRRLLIQHLHVWSAESAMLVWQREYIFIKSPLWYYFRMKVWCSISQLMKNIYAHDCAGGSITSGLLSEGAPGAVWV